MQAQQLRHLQGAFARHGVVGVDNGLFGDFAPPYAAACVDAARAGRPEPILAAKAGKRRAMLSALQQAGKDARSIGWLRGSRSQDLTTLADDVPVFFMFGRPDPGQKGFDVLAHAIARLPRGAARFVLTPSGAGPEPFESLLTQLAADRNGDVVIFPFRMESGYLETMAGATFVVMPSLYEPFGGATEPYLAGTPVVARATGGITQQIVDVDTDPRRATGLLYRERPVDHNDLGAQWAAIQDADTPEGRRALPLYTAMVDALADAVGRAGALAARPAAYAGLLANLGDQARSFSWEDTCRAYTELYARAVR